MRRAAALGCSAGWLPLLLPVLASGFVLTGLGNTSGTPPSDLPGNSHRWNVPASSTSDEGLGGGLSWVLEAGFCDRMRPRFPERQILGGVDIPGLDFVSCEDVHDALLRAFATWSANHKLITFTDLAQASRCESQFVTGELSDSCPWELYIGTDDGVAYPRLAAYVLNYRSSSVDSQWFQGSVRSSAGTLDYGVDAHARSVMRMQTHLCWYLDATFCYMFQEASDNDNVDVRAPTPGTPPPVRAPPADRAPPRPLQMQLIVRVACFFLLGLAITRLLTIVFWCYLAISCTRGTARRGDQQHGSIGGVAIRSRKGCSPGVSACLDYLASLSPLVNLGALFCLIFPPIFYERIFLPCWECYDFEAAVAHEVGHVLGFGHPDDIPEINLVAGNDCAVSNATCTAPFQCAAYQNYVESDKSIMHSLTRHAPVACLAQADLDGLHFLYPLCDELLPQTVACVKSRRLTGWIRLALVAGVPFFLAVLLIMLPLSWLRYRDQERLRRLEQGYEGASKAADKWKAEATVQLLRQAARTSIAEAISRPVTALLGGRSRPTSRSSVVPRTAEPKHAAWGIDAVLALPKGLEVLAEFCEAEQSGESLALLRAVKAWRAGWEAGGWDEEKKRAGADVIIETFLCDGADMEVCVPGGHGDFSELGLGMFERGTEHAHSTLLLDIFPRFEESEAGCALRAELPSLQSAQWRAEQAALPSRPASKAERKAERKAEKKAADAEKKRNRGGDRVLPRPAPPRPPSSKTIAAELFREAGEVGEGGTKWALPRPRATMTVEAAEEAQARIDSKRAKRAARREAKEARAVAEEQLRAQQARLERQQQQELLQQRSLQLQAAQTASTASLLLLQAQQEVEREEEQRSRFDAMHGARRAAAGYNDGRPAAEPQRELAVVPQEPAGQTRKKRAGFSAAEPVEYGL